MKKIYISDKIYSFYGDVDFQYIKPYNDNDYILEPADNFNNLQYPAVFSSDYRNYWSLTCVFEINKDITPDTANIITITDYKNNQLISLTGSKSLNTDDSEFAININGKSPLYFKGLANKNYIAFCYNSIKKTLDIAFNDSRIYLYDVDLKFYDKIWDGFSLSEDISWNTPGYKWDVYHNPKIHVWFGITPPVFGSGLPSQRLTSPGVTLYRVVMYDRCLSKTQLLKEASIIHTARITSKCNAEYINNYNSEVIINNVKEVSNDLIHLIPSGKFIEKDGKPYSIKNNGDIEVKNINEINIDQNFNKDGEIYNIYESI